MIAGAGALFLLLSSGLAPESQAQTNPTEWSEPRNLSASGLATAPLVVDTVDEQHIIWQDRFAGWMYSRGQNDNWTEPVSVSLPFSDPPFTSPAAATFAGLLAPVLLLDDNDLLHGFWLDRQRLFYSNVALSELAESAAWSPPQQLSASATAVAVAASGQEVHLAYVRPLPSAELPTGVYYRNWRDGSWGNATLIYQSDYLRASIEEPLQLDIAVATNNSVFVAWDNRLLDLIQMTSSRNRGETWEEPTIVDARKPDEDPGLPGPRNVQIANIRGELHLSWMARQDGGKCILQHQSSADNGRTWETPQPVFEDRQDCPTSHHFIDAHPELPMILLTLRNEAYLLAWNGAEWSLPEGQGSLTSFVHPQTYRPLTMGCLQPVITSERDLAVLGCGAGPTSDIWLRKRAGIEASSGWSFAGASTWSTHTIAAQLVAEPQSPSLLSDGQRIHMMWSQTTTPANAPGSSIHYSRWNGSTWTRPNAVLRSPSGMASEPAMALDKVSERLLVVWQNGQSGELYFSQANTARANAAAEWSEAIALPKPEQAVASSPDIFVSSSGSYYVAYTVALNEARGVYLTQYQDQGESWSDPVKVFDASAANWDMVGPLSVAGGGQGALHLLWSQYSLPPNPQPLSLHYARSEDGGLTWSTAASFVNRPTSWSQLIVASNITHRFWQDLDGNRAGWHQWSLDNGRNWAEPVRVSALGAVVQRLAATADAAGQIHLVQIQRNLEGQASLAYSVWQGEQWRTDGDLRLQNDTLGNSTELLVAAIDGLDDQQDHQLAAIYVGITPSLVNELTQSEPRARFLFSQRSIEAPVLAMTPTSPATPPEPTAMPEPTAILLAEATPTPTAVSFPLEIGEDDFQIGPFTTRSREGILALSIIPAGLIVLMVFGFAVYYIRLRD
jgi:hypothetical protein